MFLIYVFNLIVIPFPVESYFQEKMLQERVIVTGVYYLRKGPITMTIVSKKFPGLQILQ